MERQLSKKFIPFFVFSLLSLSVFAAIFAANNNAQGTTLHVYPTMSRGDIQAVVDDAANGDTILFHAGFYDWSDAPQLPRYASEGAINIIDKTLTIKGESGTVIHGPVTGIAADGQQIGSHAFHVVDLNLNNDVTFDGLTIQEFMRGICCWYVYQIVIPHSIEYSSPCGRDISIMNCKFEDIRRDAISLGPIGGDILIRNNNMSSDRGGMYISWYNGKDNKDWQSENTRVTIRENQVEAGDWGIVLSLTTNVLVEKNTINMRGPESSIYGIYSEGAKKGNIISSNTIQNCRRGIHIYGGLWSAINFESQEVVIEKNTLRNITRFGILLYGDLCFGHTVSKNEVHMVPDPITGIRSIAGIYLESHDDYFGQNKISGSGRIAFWLSGYNYSQDPDYGGSAIYTNHETIQANNINKFTPNICHFLLDVGTHDNLIVGSGMGHNTYIDYGTNNRITGVTPMSGGIGQALSDAIKEKNEELQEAHKIIH